MPVTSAINNVLGRLRASVLATLTAQGETPAEIPSCETSAQISFEPSGLPLTILEIKSCKISSDDCPVNSIRLCQPVIVHHLRALDPAGSASDTATARLSAIAAALFADYRLESVSVNSDPSIEQVSVMALARGEDNPVQMLLDQNQQGASLAAVALHVEIQWVEDLI